MKESKTNRKKAVGTVVSNKMEKTVVVMWETYKRHPLYKKFVKDRVTVKAHDHTNELNVGDKVRLESTRPISKDTRWRVLEVLEKAEVKG